MGDSDSAMLSGAAVQITANYRSSEDLLAFTDTAAISGSWNVTTGTLTLSGSASPADYQAALRSITYRNTSDTPGMLARTVTFTAVDAGGATSTPATRTIEFDKASQATLTITGPASATYGHADYDITTSGGWAPAPSSSTPAAPPRARSSAGKLHVDSGTGTCAITATKAADANYLSTTSVSYPVDDQGTPGHHVRCPVGQDLRRPRLHGQRHILVRPPDQVRGQRPVQH